MAIAMRRQTDPIEATRKALKDAADRGAAIELLTRRAKADPDLLQAIIDRFRPDLIEELCALAVRYVAGDERSTVRRVAHTEDTIDRGLISRVGRIKEGIALWTLPSGVKLQRATRENLIEAAEFVERQARTLLAAGRQYRAIAAKLKPGEVVSDILDDEELAEIFDRS
jgi:hypothetical protein